MHYTYIYMPYPLPHPSALSLPSVHYSVSSLPMSKATAETVVHACPVLYIQESCSCMCVHMQHAWQPTTFCSHDLHISCFPEGIMTDGHLGAPPAWPYTFLYVEKERDFFFLFLFVFCLPIEPVNFFVEMGLKKGRFPSRSRIERLSCLYGLRIFVLFSLSVEIIDRPFIIRLLPPVCGTRGASMRPRPNLGYV